MTDYEPFVSIGLALGAGLLVGFEREQAAPSVDGAFMGGARTFPLVAMLGAISMLLAGPLGPAFPVAALVGVVALAVIADREDHADHHDVHRDRSRSMTAEAALLVTFAIGALAGSGPLLGSAQHRALVVAALSVVVTFLLSSKPRLNVLVGRVSREDFHATLKFLILAVLVLPMLPDAPVDPLGVVRPFQVGTMMVLIASISFVGYVASRLLGAGRGLMVTAVAGGLVSSTAVTLSFAGRARKEPTSSPEAAAAIALASTIMVGRVAVEIAVVHRALLELLVIPLSAMAVVGVGAAVLAYRSSRREQDGSSVSLTNPFELGTSVRFGLLFTGVLLLSETARTYAGATGMYLAAALAGATDVDAITLSTAQMVKVGLSPSVGATTIVIAVASNTVMKAALAGLIGGWALGRRVLLLGAAMLLAGAIGHAAAGGW